MPIAILCAAGACALWGLMFLAPWLLPGFTPLEIAAGRFIVYGGLSLLLLLPLWPRLRVAISTRDLLALGGLSLSGHLGFYMLLVAAIQRVGIAPVSLIMGLVPLVVTVLGRHDGDGVPLSRLLWPLAMILAGMLSINLEAFRLGEDTGQTLLGLLLATAALLCWSGFAVSNARWLKRHPGIDSHSGALLIGVVSGALALLLWAGHAWLTAPRLPAEPRDWTTFWGVSLMIGLLGSVVANGLWNAASRRLPLTLIGQLFVFETLFALLYGFLYLARPPSPLEGLAMLLLVAGVVMAIRRHAPTRSGMKDARHPATLAGQPMPGDNLVSSQSSNDSNHDRPDRTRDAAPAAASVAGERPGALRRP